MRSAGEGYLLEQRQLLDEPRENVFDFFADARNLEAITPDRLRFEVRDAEEPIAEGSRIRYRLRLRGIPLRWVSRIAAWDPPRAFADVQMQGPYRRWEHVHLFVDRGDRTLAVDRVRYNLPIGPAGSLAHRLFVADDLRSIFAYRARRLAERFGTLR
ncbi:CDP-paratose 2-epimerase [Thermoplasmatales archaeon SW_10_69_26]|nr:MAG: CDP-paratose 2-epimerase [Thermoplasmatales archaeon SW_10_69_26]